MALADQAEPRTPGSRAKPHHLKHPLERACSNILFLARSSCSLRGCPPCRRSIRRHNGLLKCAVMSLPVDERQGTWTNANRAHAADDNAVVVTDKQLLDLAIERGQAALQDRGARRQRRPLRAGISSRSLETIFSSSPARARCCATNLRRNTRFAEGTARTQSCGQRTRSTEAAAPTERRQKPR